MVLNKSQLIKSHLYLWDFKSKFKNKIMILHTTMCFCQDCPFSEMQVRIRGVQVPLRSCNGDRD